MFFVELSSTKAECLVGAAQDWEMTEGVRRKVNDQNSKAIRIRTKEKTALGVEAESEGKWSQGTTKKDISGEKEIQSLARRRKAAETG